jgi:hypothetical protein
MFSGGHGSSYQSGSNFSRRRATRSVPAAVIWPCMPMMMSPAVTTSSRMAPMTRSAVSAAAKENWSGTFWPRLWSCVRTSENGSTLIAVKPRST